MPTLDLDTVSLTQLKQDLQQLQKDETPDTLVGLSNDGRLVQIALDEGRCSRNEFMQYSANLSAYLQLKASTDHLDPQQLQVVEGYLQQISEREAKTVKPNFSMQSTRAEPEQPFAITEELQILNKALELIFEDHSVFIGSRRLLNAVTSLSKAGQLDNPECLKKAYAFVTAIVHSDYYKSDQDALDKLKDTIEKIPESFFKKLIHAGMSSINSRHNSHESADTPATMTALVAKAFALEPTEAEVFTQVYKESDNIHEMKTALETCQRLKEQGCYFPFSVLLPGIKENPRKVHQLATCPADNNPVDFRRTANSLLRHCLLIHANLGNTSREAERYLTTINLWHNPQIFDQIAPLHKYRDLYTLLNGKSLPPNTLLFALADNQMTPDIIKSLNHSPIDELKKCLKEASTSAIILVSNAIDDAAPPPFTATIKTCSDIQRYINNKMTADEEDAKKGRMETVLKTVGQSKMCQIQDKNLIEKIADDLFSDPADIEKKTKLIEDFWSWAKACKEQRDTEHFETFHANQQALLIELRRRLAVRSLQSLSEELENIEPLVTVSRTLEKLTEGIEQNIKAQSPEQLNFIAQQLQKFGLKPGQRTISNADCGFAAMALMTGESPYQVRTAAAQAAKDLHTFLKTEDLTKIKGDEDYKKRIKQGAGFLKDLQLYRKGFLSLEERANYLKADMQKAQISQDPENYWLNPEDLPCIAIAYNTPVFLFTPDSLHSEQLQCIYATPEGELIECNTEEDYQTCIELAADHQSNIRALVNIGHPHVPHWWPMVPCGQAGTGASFSRQNSSLSSRFNSIECGPPSLTESLLDRQHSLGSLKRNPGSIPRGQNILPRPESPTNDKSPEASEDLDPVFEKASQGLERLEQDTESLPPQHVASSPGFLNHSRRTCFANAALKQRIASMSMKDVLTLQKKACALYKAHSKIYKLAIKHGTKRYDGARRAVLILRFAQLAEAVIRTRCGQPDIDVISAQIDFFQACHKFGQSQDVSSGSFKALFPYGENERFWGKHDDPHEFMLKVMDIVDEERELTPPLTYSTQIQATDNQDQVVGKESVESAILEVDMTHDTLSRCLGPKIEVIDPEQKVRFPDGQPHPCQRHDVYTCDSPEDIQHVHFQIKIWSYHNPYRTDILREKARKLIFSEPVENISFQVKNSQTDQLIDLPLRLKSIVIHWGVTNYGHYMALERDGDNWYLHDDYSLTKITGGIRDYFTLHDDEIPYMFMFEHDKPTKT